MATEKLMELLLQHHVFPGEYVFRVIGSGEAGGVLVRTGIESSLARAGVPLVSLDPNPSAGGKFLAWRVRAVVQSPEQVIELSAVFQNLQGVRVVM